MKPVRSEDFLSKTAFLGMGKYDDDNDNHNINHLGNQYDNHKNNHKDDHKNNLWKIKNKE